MRRRASAGAALVLLAAGCCAISPLPAGYTGYNFGEGATCSETTGANCCCATGVTGSGNACTDTEKLVCLRNEIAQAAELATKTSFDAFKANGAKIWILISGFLVFFMQAGFAMLEAGAVRSDNTLNIIFKNLVDCCIGAVGFFVCGYGFAYGRETEDTNKFIGGNNFFLMDEHDDESGQHLFFFQFAFAATAATIVSGAVAERTQLIAYLIYSVFITGWVYPVVVHWVWSSGGFLSAFRSQGPAFGSVGMIDYAGSGVVHMVGGFAGLCGAYFVGPRKGRFASAIEIPFDDVQHGTRVTMRILYPERKPEPGKDDWFDGDGVHALPDRYSGEVVAIAADRGYLRVRFNDAKNDGPPRFHRWGDHQGDKVEIPRELAQPRWWWDGHRQVQGLASFPTEDDKVHGHTQSHSSQALLSALGGFILWFGWYGFNCGSTLAWDGSNAGKVATTTTLSAAGGCVSVTVIHKVWTQFFQRDSKGKKRTKGEYSVTQAINGVLAGLVSITAPCSTVDELSALFIGILGGIVYILASALLVRLQIDDPLNAWPVHGACGVWGCLSVGVFARHKHIVRAYAPMRHKPNVVSGGEQFAIQLAGVMCIMCWVVANCGFLFWLLSKMGMLRVDAEQEEYGMDVTEHGNKYAASFMAGHSTVSREDDKKARE